MKWFILVLMMGTQTDGARDWFWYQKPEFQTVDECIMYVQQNAIEIKADMQFEFGLRPVEMVYCVREDKVKKLLPQEIKA